MDNLNQTFANQLLFTDPDTGEELRPKYEPQDRGGHFELYVTNKDGSKNWKHTIKTEEFFEPVSIPPSPKGYKD